MKGGILISNESLESGRYYTAVAAECRCGEACLAMARLHEGWESRAGKITSGAGSGGEWIPFCHSGLRMRAKFLLSLKKKYKPREPVGKNATQALSANTIFETVLTVRNRFIQHWAFHGIDRKQFVVSRSNALDIDEKVTGSSKRSFHVCADSGDGLVPEVIECGNLFGAQFECSEKFPVTPRFVENFVAEKYPERNFQILEKTTTLRSHLQRCCLLSMMRLSLSES